VKYANAVEFGTSRFSGRRYMRRGIESARDKIHMIIKTELSLDTVKE
jgi:hypothetical protein